MRSRRSFTLSLRPRKAKDPARTWERVYAVVRRIPRGRVATYGQVAALAGFPRAPRVAGYALHALPDGSPVPWHRVVAAGGRLSLARLSLEAALTQRMRLEKEGVHFDARGRVRMEEHAWKARARGGF
jgi:methylated-DNA-protein-cysteine methyltransferase related protein